VGGLSTILGAVNMLTTVISLRAPGMTMWRLPIFTWNIVFTSILVLIAFPIFTAALCGLLADRLIGAHVFDPANGGSILWQHLFWFFGHPEVYIVALPYFGITGLSVVVWAHHMFATGAVLLPFFAITTFLIAIPTGIKFFNWIGTMWRGNFTVLHSISTIGAFLLGLSMLPFIYNVIRSYRYGEPAGADDPWGYGNSLEWATTCPPPRHNFTDLPRIRSERPAFELHHPNQAHRFRDESANTHTATRNGEHHPSRKPPPRPNPTNKTTTPTPAASSSGCSAGSLWLTARWACVWKIGP
jgi:heme/copper-type cytochrome/quinol oxidase subunit 1